MPAPRAAQPCRSTLAAKVLRQRLALRASLGEPAPTAEEISALRAGIKGQLEDVTVDWLDEVAAVYAEACLDVRAMRKRHVRVLSTCQHGVSMPYPAKTASARLLALSEKLPVDEVIELLDAYDPDAEIVLVMFRTGRRGDEYEVFRLPRLDTPPSRPRSSLRVATSHRAA